MIFRDTVVRIRAGVQSTRSGGTTADWSPDAVDRLTVGRLSVQPNTQDDATDAEGTLVSNSTRVISADGHVPDIAADDRIEYRGSVYKIVGDIGYWPDPTMPNRDHVEFRMVTHRGG